MSAKLRQLGGLVDGFRAHGAVQSCTVKSRPVDG